VSVDHFVVPASLGGERVDRAVAMLTGWSRADVQELVGAGAILVAGRAVPKSRRLAEGDEVEITDEPRPPAPPEAEPLPVDVRHEDADLLVVSKPAGVVVHPGAGHERGTLVAGLLARYPEIAGVGDPLRPGIVHRLDRDSSGLLLVARSARGYDGLVAALAARAVDRHYLVLAWGRFDAPRGLIDAPIGRSMTRRTRMAVRDEGKDARTAYEVREEYADPAVTLLECKLETGRTHQIRVHLAAIGHPVVGDGVYGGSRPSIRVPRPFLHAFHLALAHPVSGAPLRFDDALPDELEAVRARLAAA
jgi:23S rRNA pseudouridine1911/1915/1917 synthase